MTTILVVLYRQESILTFLRLPQSQSNIVKYCVLQICCKIWNLQRCAGSASWPQVSHWLSVSSHMACGGWELSTPPPLHREAPGSLINWHFIIKFLSNLEHCHMILWLARLVLTDHHCHRHQQLLSSPSPRERVSSSFLSAVKYFLTGCLLP